MSAPNVVQFPPQEPKSEFDFYQYVNQLLKGLLPRSEFTFVLTVMLAVLVPWLAVVTSNQFNQATQIATNAAANAALQQRVTQLETSLANTNQTVVALQQRSAVQDGIIASLQNQVHRGEQEKAVLDAQVKALRQQQQDLTQKLNDVLAPGAEDELP